MHARSWARERETDGRKQEQGRELRIPATRTENRDLNLRPGAYTDTHTHVGRSRRWPFEDKHHDVARPAPIASSRERIADATRVHISKCKYVCVCVRETGGGRWRNRRKHRRRRASGSAKELPRQEVDENKEWRWRMCCCWCCWVGRARKARERERDDLELQRAPVERRSEKKREGEATRKKRYVEKGWMRMQMLKRNTFLLLARYASSWHMSVSVRLKVKLSVLKIYIGELIWRESHPL